MTTRVKAFFEICAPNTAAAVLDLDGTLWHDDVPIAGAIDFMRCLSSRSVPFVLLSNTGERTRDEVALKFQRVLGFSVDAARIYTALDNLANAVDRLWNDGEIDEVLVIAPARNEAWKRLALARYATLFDPSQILPANQRRVLLALSDGKFDGDYQQLCTAVSDELYRGSQLFVTSDDDTLAENRNGIIGRKPGPGLFVRNVRAITPSLKNGRGIRIFGKGRDSMMPIMALAKLKEQGFDGPHRKVYFVGDRLDADVRAAFQVGCIAVHVESGCHTPIEYDEYPEDVPHVAANTVDDLHGVFEQSSLSLRFHDSVRDNIVTAARKMRAGIYGDLARLTVRHVEKFVRVPPRRVQSLPNLTNLG